MSGFVLFPLIFAASFILTMVGLGGGLIFSGKTETAAAIPGSARRILGGSLIGMIIGFVAGLLRIGGGVFIVPMLIFILNVPTKTAAATSIFIVVFSSFSGFLAHISIASPDWRFILTAAIFSIGGGQLGSRIMAEKLKSHMVRKIFGAVLLILVFKLFQRAVL